MGLDERLISAMEPATRYDVTYLAVALREDYAKTFFGLKRLQSLGFVREDDGYFSLDDLGEELHELLSRR